MYKFETEDELKAFICDNAISTSEVMKILGCSRQNIDDLIKRKKLTPIKHHEHVKLFWKPDVLARIQR